MANEFAPRTFACVVDLSGMASLADDIAYNLPGGSILNARYSDDPASPAHLENGVMKKMGNTAKIVVIHGMNDKYCLASDKKRVVENMKAAGLDVEAHFIEKKDVDGKLMLNAAKTSLGVNTLCHPFGVFNE